MQNGLNYGVIGNCTTAALVSEKGYIEWLCFPYFDSPSVFAAILDKNKGGCFGFEVSNDYKITQSYVPQTNILSTEYDAGSDAFAVVDFMPCYHLNDNKERVIDQLKYIGIYVGLKVSLNLRLSTIRLQTMHVETLLLIRPLHL